MRATTLIVAALVAFTTPAFAQSQLEADTAAYMTSLNDAGRSTSAFAAMGIAECGLTTGDAYQDEVIQTATVAFAMAGDSGTIGGIELFNSTMDGTQIDVPVMGGFISNEAGGEAGCSRVKGFTAGILR